VKAQSSECFTLTTTRPLPFEATLQNNMPTTTQEGAIKTVLKAEGLHIHDTPPSTLWVADVIAE